MTSIATLHPQRHQYQLPQQVARSQTPRRSSSGSGSPGAGGSSLLSQPAPSAKASSTSSSDLDYPTEAEAAQRFHAWDLLQFQKFFATYEPRNPHAIMEEIVATRVTVLGEAEAGPSPDVVYPIWKKTPTSKYMQQHWLDGDTHEVTQDPYWEFYLALRSFHPWFVHWNEDPEK
eukprot:g8311.t1